MQRKCSHTQVQDRRRQKENAAKLKTLSPAITSAAVFLTLYTGASESCKCASLGRFSSLHAPYPLRTTHCVHIVYVSNSGNDKTNRPVLELGATSIAS